MLASSAHTGFFIAVHLGPLRPSAVIFFISATVPRDSWGDRDLDGLIVALPRSLLSLTYQGKYIHDQIIAHSVG